MGVEEEPRCRAQAGSASRDTLGGHSLNPKP